ncbi:PIG-L family deacetylase [Kytococcus schroeteri]|uniref:PIG-L family deacetylase n=1 Tax=Kytococcus schroeteri TaxID=138300 RepID=A0A2I1PBN1_9MICO|nr:PIG-L family deacetylase [Kytococcus schroeteri]PKZ41991.1 PIG-L family deacetylase [Kytococcus schroeteri]
MLIPDPTPPRRPGCLAPESLPAPAEGSVLPLPAVAGPVAVLSAHPDDEVIGAGRLVAHLAGTVGATAHCATAGEGCYLGRPVPGVDDVGAVRRAEWLAAVAALGARPGRWGGLPDGALDARPDELAAWVAAVLEESAPSAVLVPWRLDPHPDHAALGEVVAREAGRRGIEVLEFPVWATVWCRPEQLAATGWRLAVVGTPAHTEAAREAALYCYPSQTTEQVPGWGAVVPPGALAHHGVQRLAVGAPGEVA